jgi:predicted phosphodiesterase
MRILLVSDLHYTLKQLDWVLSVSGDYDLVVMAGDHLDIASIVEYIARIAGKTRVVACSGNHDLNARIDSTLVVNPGRQIGRVPAHVELELGDGVVRWSSLAGVEERTLALVDE